MNKHFSSLILFFILGVVLLDTSALAAKTEKRVIYKEQFYYVDEQMFLCSVSNHSTHQMYYGQSQKKKYAVMYARAACQMQSYKGQCFVKADCNWQFVKVRKRRFVKTQV